MYICTIRLAREVRLALSDDFDTPRAVRHLASLCANVSPHLKELAEGDLGPVVSAANFTAETLSLLGVGSSVKGTVAAAPEAATGGRGGPSEGSVGVGGDEGGLADGDGLPPAREVVAALVEFRRLVRKHVLARSLTKIGPARSMKR